MNGARAVFILRPSVAVSAPGAIQPTPGPHTAALRGGHRAPVVARWVPARRRRPNSGVVGVSTNEEGLPAEQP
jgi:hypothetical protein